jgi:hypothetical protein
MWAQVLTRDNASLLIPDSVGLDTYPAAPSLCRAGSASYARLARRRKTHLWPDKDESSRAAVAVALASREDSSRTEGVLT